MCRIYPLGEYCGACSLRGARRKIPTHAASAATPRPSNSLQTRTEGRRECDHDQGHSTVSDQFHEHVDLLR